jgi:DNA-binding sugar fermentation-stimulating protein
MTQQPLIRSLWNGCKAAGYLVILRLLSLRAASRFRFDFYVEAEGKRSFIEVKGVTLEEEGIVRFPDAPTERE